MQGKILRNRISEKVEDPLSSDEVCCTRRPSRLSVRRAACRNLSIWGVDVTHPRGESYDVGLTIAFRPISLRLCIIYVSPHT